MVASQKRLSVINGRSVMRVVQPKTADSLLHRDTKLSVSEIEFLSMPREYRYILTHYFHFSYVLVKRKEKKVGKNYLCSVISIKIHFIFEVLHCSGKSDTKGLKCNYVCVLCIYKHAQEGRLTGCADSETKRACDIYPTQ